LKSLGHKEVDCVVLDIDEQQEKALNIALNKISGDWDMPLLNELLKDLSASGFDATITGFDAAEIEDLFRGDVPREVEEDGFDTEKALENIKEPISKRGDIWHLDKHRLRCGDSTARADVDLLMGGEKAKLVVTDLPYNVAYNQGSNNRHPSWKTRDGILNDSMPEEQFREFLKACYSCVKDSIEAGECMYAFMSSQEWHTIHGVLRETGWHWSSSIIWVKDTMVLGRKDWQPRYEAIWYGWVEGTQRIYPLKDERTQTDVWEFNRPKKSPLHPTQKPVDVISKPIVFSSRPGDIVLDVCGGSGTTLIAADKLQRIGYLQELDPKFVDVIVARYIESHGGDDSGVFLERDGVKTAYKDLGI
jgi:DNA modification methylase